MDFSESQLQQQYQQPPYDPSQSQSYYPYQPYQSYYQTDYTAAAYQQPTQDSIPILPPGVSAAPEPPPQPVISFQPQQQNPYYPAEQQPNPNPSYPVPSGLNHAAAAAVAALSQLTQFAGSMDAAEKARAGMHERQWQGEAMQMQLHVGPHGVYQAGPVVGHRGGRGGGGRRGCGSQRGGGGGRGNFGHRPPRTNGSTSQSQGRGRGRGNKRHFPQHVASQSETLPTSVSEQGNVEVSAGMQGEQPVAASVPQSAVAPGKAAQPGKVSSTKKPPQNAWCELCRVACTGLDILEKHKSGKKHKKNLQRFEELQKVGNSTQVLHTGSCPITASDPALVTASAPSNTAPTIGPSLISEVTATVMDGVQNQQQSLLESKSEVLAQVEGGETTAVKNSPKNMSTVVINNEKKIEPEQQIDKEGHAKAPDGESTKAQGKKRRFDSFNTQQRGLNRRIRGGRGGKTIRISDQPTRPTESRKPKELVPIVCDLCNVKCDTAAVFEIHLSGKKHQSKLKRFQDHQAMFGPIGLQALYPPNPNTQPIFIPQGHQPAMFHPQGSFHQPVSYLPPGQQTVAYFEPPAQQNPLSHLANSSWDGLNNDRPLEFQGQPSLGNLPNINVAQTEETPVGTTDPPKDSAGTVADNVGAATFSGNINFP